MNTLTVEFELQLDECKAAMQLHGRKQSKRANPYRQFSFIGYASVAIGVLLLVTQSTRSGWIAPVVLIGVGLFIPIRLTLIAFEQQSAEWNASLHLAQPTRWEFRNEEIRISSPLFSGTYQWNVFKSWTEASAMFLLYQTKEKYHVIPKKAFATKAELVAFRELLAEKLQEPVSGFPVTVKTNS